MPLAKRIQMGVVALTWLGIGCKPPVTNESAQIHRIGVLAHSGDWAQALRACEQALLENPSSLELHLWMARVLSRLSRPSEAAETLARALEHRILEDPNALKAPSLDEFRLDPAFGPLLNNLQFALEESPSLDSANKLISDAASHRLLPWVLPRLRSPQATPFTRSLLASSSPATLRCGLVGLLHQNACDADTRRDVLGCLNHPDEGVREAAAEYFVWHGANQDQASLRLRLTQEPKPHIAASIRAGLELIALRETWPAGVEGTPPYSTTVEALKGLRSNKDRSGAMAWFKNGWAIENRLRFDGRPPNATTLAEQSARLNLATELFGFTAHRREARPSTELPIARAFMPPVGAYYNLERRSFARVNVPPSPFRGTVHCGEDVAWFRDDAPVVAVADGVVRLVTYAYSWGVLVVIEHQLPGQEGAICSLYGHLSPALTVSLGQVVTRGQRIGSIGRTHTWENGGYGAHLHFGLHRGPYRPPETPSDRDPTWVTGYLGPEVWARGLHGWTDPQAFIRARDPEAAGKAMPTP